MSDFKKFFPFEKWKNVINVVIFYAINHCDDCLLNAIIYYVYVDARCDLVNQKRWIK